MDIVILLFNSDHNKDVIKKLKYELYIGYQTKREKPHI